MINSILLGAISLNPNPRWPNVAAPTPMPIVVATNGFGLRITEAANGQGLPVVKALNGYGIPVVIVASGGLPVVGSGNSA